MSDANDLLLDAYSRVAAAVPEVLGGLDTEAAAWTPAPGANSTGWLVWHLTRVLDDHVVAGAAGQEQVHTAQGWAERLGLPLAADDTGYGHSPDQVAAVRFDDLGDLVGYHRAVQEAVVPYLQTVEGLGEVVDERWDPPVTRGVRLVSVADDMARHIGQAEYVRGLWESRG
ncbi:hypothetical protein GCM10011519_35470 [Marmoricola endophyticus]|uniref:DUF664 domain-containing protein n=1 Tax=Marmoricola endophyticus TaxID=2040280 RepID=A0A917FAW7_9ACTN|nr:DUF664 domain-containing protein [Marmoricola endophyticus]GGF58567.1 hypothetical protein GCM10011519_35470 [Marmoricola endophyticus]